MVSDRMLLGNWKPQQINFKSYDDHEIFKLNFCEHNE